MGSVDRAESPMHPRRRRCIGDVSVEKIGLHIEPHRRCIGDAARSTDPMYFDPIWAARSQKTTQDEKPVPGNGSGLPATAY